MKVEQVTVRVGGCVDAPVISRSKTQKKKTAKGQEIGHQRWSYLRVDIIFGQFLKKKCHGRKERTKG